MSTRAGIAMINRDGSVSMITVHWDGDLSVAGETLVRYYSDFDRASNLLALGNLSSLGKNLEPNRRMQYFNENPDEFDKLPKKEQERLYKEEGDYTVVYHRDQNEELRIKRFENVPSYLKALNSYTELDFNYLLGNNDNLEPTWYLVTPANLIRLYIDEQNTDLANCFKIGNDLKEINIADESALYDKYDQIYNPTGKYPYAAWKYINADLDKALVKQVMEYLADFQHQFNLAGSASDKYQPRYFNDYLGGQVTIYLRDPETDEDCEVGISLIDINSNCCLETQILKQLMNKLPKMQALKQPAGSTSDNLDKQQSALSQLISQQCEKATRQASNHVLKQAKQLTQRRKNYSLATE